SQHDGKDAAVVAELCALGRSTPWPFVAAGDVNEEMALAVDWLESHTQNLGQCYGHLEGLLARHWPEATRYLEVTSGTLLRCLARHGGPAGLAADPDGRALLRSWGRQLLTEEKLLS